MNVFPLLKQALAPLGLPCEPEVYEGDARDYIVYNYADERPALDADDDSLLDETSVQVHYFTPGDPHAVKKGIRRRLRAAGFYVTGTQQFYEDDTKYRHVVVEATIGGEIND